MIRKIKKFAAISLVAFSLVLTAQAILPSQASASLFSNSVNQACEGTQLSNGAANCGASQANGVNHLIAVAINILSVVIGIAAVIMILVNGLRFVTSGGDSNAVGSAKRGIIYALIGLVLVGVAQFLVFFVIDASSKAVGNP